ncbi:transcriptional regulator [Halorubrum sp. C3]|nr:transcriptional regulator [Halorubrum sp. C3]
MVSSFVTLYKMSYDTEHVRNGGDTPRTITGISTFTELLQNPSLASLYTSIRRSTAATGPELIETTTVSKKTVYDYLHKLEQAGLISKVNDDGGTAVYTAEEFELTLTVRETEVSITPELIEVIAQKNEYPAIERVLEDHGIVTFALAYDLVKAHSEGNVTIRQIASLTDLSAGTAYDLVEALYSILDLGDDESSPTTYPADIQQTGENSTSDAHSEARQDSSATEEPAPEDWIESTDDTEQD